MLEKLKDGTFCTVLEILTGDETWIYCYEAEQNQQSQVWIFPDEEHPTKMVRSRSVRNKMVASFV